MRGLPAAAAGHRGSALDLVVVGPLPGNAGFTANRAATATSASTALLLVVQIAAFLLDPFIERKLRSSVRRASRSSKLKKKKKKKTVRHRMTERLTVRRDLLFECSITLPDSQMTIEIVQNFVLVRDDK